MACSIRRRSPVTGPYLGAVLLLGGAGMAKVVRPHDTAVALRAAGLGLRLSRTEKLVRAGAAAEVAVAGAALVTRGPAAAWAVAGSYGGFAAFTAAALVKGWPIASCGCFGRPDTEPTVAHVVVNAAAAGAAGWWAGASRHDIPTFFSPKGVRLALNAVVCAGVAYRVVGPASSGGSAVS